MIPSQLRIICVLSLLYGKFSQWLVEYCSSLPSTAQPGYSYHPPWAHTAGTYTTYSVHIYVHVDPCMYKQTPLALYCLLGRLW